MRLRGEGILKLLIDYDDSIVDIEENFDVSLTSAKKLKLKRELHFSLKVLWGWSEVSSS